MSKDCTSGTPAFIIVANWRAKIAMSEGVIGFLRSPNRGFAFFLTTCGVTPWRRSCAFASVTLSLWISPLVALPRRSLPV